MSTNKNAKEVQNNEELENEINIAHVINFGIPHVAEQIFESIDTPGLIQCLSVSESWKFFAKKHY